ncbi:MAG: NB-ARC domain-containing protein [Anaerolineae bacterium]
MDALLEILRNALPEALGGLIAAAILAVLGYLYMRLRKQPTSLPEQQPLEPPPQPTIPSNLPPRKEFIGREKERARVREALASRWPLTCIDGIGGIGKTALALEVAGECLRVSKGEVPADGILTFDGFIWTTAKDRELALNDVLDAVARTLDYPGIAQQPLEEKQESVRKLLQTKPYLLIVDNFETVTDDAVRDFLLRLPEPSKALITSREQKLRQAWAVSLKGLEQEEALTPIRSEGRRIRLPAKPKAIR